MTELLTGFVPFGEFMPDQRLLANGGLYRAENVVPAHGDYVSSPALTRIVSVAEDLAFGLHVDQRSGHGYAGIGDDIYEVTEAGVVTPRSIAGGYPALPSANGFWRGTSVGANVVMTDYTEPVQYLASGAALFANMITTTGATGFAPRARHVFMLRQNLFLANCFLPLAYDGLAAGANPTLIAWSQSGNIRAFGSARANPELIGAGFQPLEYDLGSIRCAVGSSDYGIVGFSDGLVRVDGPPYTARVIVTGPGCLYPYGMCAAGDDVYLWGGAGLARLRGGEPPLEILGSGPPGKFHRFLTDNATGFSAHPVASVGLLDETEAAYVVSLAYDSVNDMLFVAYSENNDLYSKALLAYNVREDRLSWFQLRHASGDLLSQALFLCPGRQTTASWAPGRDIRFLSSTGGISGEHFYSRLGLGNSFGPAVLGKGYMQLKAGAICRMRRIRPVYSVTDQVAIEQITVHLEATTKPHLTPTIFGPYSTSDPNGWIVTPPPGPAGEFLAPRFTIAANAAMHKMVEYQGFEFEAEIVGSSLA